MSTKPETAEQTIKFLSDWKAAKSRFYNSDDGTMEEVKSVFNLIELVDEHFNLNGGN